METRRLQVLVELSRMGSMRAVADLLGTSTSTVSQQIAALARETGTALVEAHGRGVRLTPAGRRLAVHAESILSAVEAAELDLDPDAPPVGTVRVSGFASAIRKTLLPVVLALAESHPRVRVIVQEHEPAEALARLAAQEVDLALTYDYNLVPATPTPGFDTVPLWSSAWGLGVPTHTTSPPEDDADTDAVAVFARFRSLEWIGNSRNRADEDVVRTIASMAGFTPRITHACDSLDLVEDLITAGMGIGLLPADRQLRSGVTLVSLSNPDVSLRAYAKTRRGGITWPPIALLLNQVQIFSRREQPAR